MQNHHETDPKQQCDRDANDATKSFDAESYDFDTVWPGPKATLTSRTEKIRWQNIRLNSCSFTLKERSDSDDIRQKSSKKQRKSLAGDAEMLTFCKVLDRGARVCGPQPRAWACDGTPWQQRARFKDLCSPWGAKKKVFLGTSSTVTLLEKNHAKNVGQFWNLAGIFLDYWRIIQSKKED